MIDLVLSLTDSLDVFTPYINTLLQVFVIIIWVWLIGKLKLSGNVSLKISLGLIFLSMIFTLVNFKSLVKISSEYAFIFLYIGVIQKIYKIKT